MASDPARRTILTHLAQEGRARVTEIARRFDISLTAVSNHIVVPEKAGLVGRRTQWREHLLEAQLQPLTEAFLWLGDLRSIWDFRPDAPETHLAKDTTND